MGNVTVDFVALGHPHGGYALILVEEGPWGDDRVHANLHSLQSRLYGCLDAALDGEVIKKYPMAQGHPLTIRVDAYDISQPELEDFFNSFASGALATPDYAAAMSAQNFHPRIEFRLERVSTHAA